MDTLSPRQSGYMCAPGACMLGGPTSVLASEVHVRGCMFRGPTSVLASDAGLVLLRLAKLLDRAWLANSPRRGARRNLVSTYAS